jgi:hypothetical protein
MNHDHSDLMDTMAMLLRGEVPTAAGDAQGLGSVLAVDELGSSEHPASETVEPAPDALEADVPDHLPASSAAASFPSLSEGAEMERRQQRHRELTSDALALPNPMVSILLATTGDALEIHNDLGRMFRAALAGGDLAEASQVFDLWQKSGKQAQGFLQARAKLEQLEQAKRDAAAASPGNA